MNLAVRGLQSIQKQQTRNKVILIGLNLDHPAMQMF